MAACALRRGRRDRSGGAFSHTHRFFSRRLLGLTPVARSDFVPAAGPVTRQEASPKNSVGPDALWRCGALFRISRNFCEFADDIPAEMTLGLRARRLGCTLQFFCQAPFRSGIGAATTLRPQPRWGQSFLSGGVMATPTFCRAPCEGRDACVAVILAEFSGRRRAILDRTPPLSNEIFLLCGQSGGGESTRLFARRLDRRDRRHVDDAARGD